jgi:hypothetical protein
LTALHVVADKLQDPPALYPGNLTLHFRDGKTRAVLDGSNWDRDADWALLRCETTPKVRPIPLVTLRRPGAEWSSFGFPDANPNGMAVGGVVRDVEAILEDTKAIQLFCEEASAGQGAPVMGLSGAPVIVDGALAGTLRFALLREDKDSAPEKEKKLSVGGTLYACPIASVLERCRDILPAPRLARYTTPHPAPRPNLGRLVTKMCDRRSQEDAFREHFLAASSGYPGRPQVYLVPGEERQCHESLVQRLAHAVGAADPGIQHGPARYRCVPWSYWGDLVNRRKMLLSHLFDELSPPSAPRLPSADTLTARGLSDLLSDHDYVMIQHEIRATQWDDITADLIRSYLSFWSELPRQEEPRGILVFVNVVYPVWGGRAWNPLRWLHRRRQRQIGAVLREIETAASPLLPCRLLAELAPVTRDEVLEWFSVHYIFESEGRRLKAVERLFQGETFRPKSMAEVEMFCEEILEEIGDEEGPR